MTKGAHARIVFLKKKQKNTRYVLKFNFYNWTLKQIKRDLMVLEFLQKESYTIILKQKK